jgi:predicted phage baseplate assembly protein
VKYGALKKTSDTPLFWLRYRIDQVLGPGYEAPPQVSDVLLNTVSAVNAISNQGELLGASNGLPNQTFQISNIPVLPNDPDVTGIVEVDEGNGFELWTEVKDFAASDRNSKVYTLNYSTGVVTFGDGEHGKIPTWLSIDGSNREAADLPNIRVTQYRSGGGSAGNAGANTITTLEKAIPFVDSVTNLSASYGGADEETVASAQERAPQTIRTISRAVTADDYVFLATQTPGARIARAAALPLTKPDTQLIRPADGSLPQAPVPIPGVVTVIVIPGVDGDPKPEPSPDTLGLVANWLDQHRIVTAELYVTGPVYRLVEIEVRVIVDPSEDIGQVSTDLDNTLLAYFHPLTGGEKGTGWGFGEPIYLSETYSQILKVNGVQRIEGTLKTYVDGKLQPQDTDVSLQRNEIVYSLKHTLDVSYPQ